MSKVYSVGSDIESFLMASGLTLSELAEGAYISRPTLAAVIKKNEASPSVLERIYSFIFRKGFRLNQAKCGLMQEKIVPPDILLFHGVKETLCEVSPQGSREDCDFGKGFYLGEHYSPSEMYWIGYMYRYICVTRKISSRLLYQWLKPSIPRPLYFSYHTQDEEAAFRAICTSIGRQEQDFNLQERLKGILRAHYGDKAPLETKDA